MEGFWLSTQIQLLCGKFPAIWQIEVDILKLSAYLPPWGEYVETVSLIRLLAARLEVVRGSWKGLQNPFPASVQADVRLGIFNQ